MIPNERRDTATLDLTLDETPPRRLIENVRIARATVLIPIAPRTRPTTCTCGAQIYWAQHPTTMRPHPVSMRHVQAVHPTSTTFGQGITHYADCPDADKHRRKARTKLMRIRRFGRND